MLLELRIANFALIDRAEMVPGPGFNVLTGETGAGKSILIQALGLLLGERADSEQVGAGQSGKAYVEGAFDLFHVPRARAWLQENDFELDETTLVITREVATEGRSRVRLNGRLATTTGLRELGDLLVDLHGQHEHQLLMRPEAHLHFLDTFGGPQHQQLRALVKESFGQWREAQRQLDALAKSEQERAQRLEMLQFHAQELHAAELTEGEEERLGEERSRLANAEKLRGAAALCRDALSPEEGEGAVAQARQALKAAQEIEALDASVATWVAELQSAIFELEDAASEAVAYADTLEADPARLDEIEARLHLLTRLKRKYGNSVAQMMAYQEQIGNELASLSLSQDEVEGLRATAETASAQLAEAAEALSASRQQLAVGFSAGVVEQLRDLAMEHARLEVAFESLETVTAEGADRAEFLFAANPGQALRPLVRIASGGEISRVMLALRSVLRNSGEDSGVPIVVFDEIDSGIGGLTAEAVGQKMRQIAAAHQVFCITHLPQIAKRADQHFRVEKHAEVGATHVEVVQLSPQERVQELARMMGSESAANLEHARALLRENQVAVPHLVEKPAPAELQTGLFDDR